MDESKNFMLGEDLQTQKTIYKWSHLYEYPAKANVQRQKVAQWLSVLGQKWGQTANGHEDSYWGDDMFGIWIMMTAARRGRCSRNH